MKIKGIDRVVVLVKDMDKAKDFLGRLFQMEFHELEDTVDAGGIRVCVAMPDGKVELISLVDESKAVEIPILKRTVELARIGYEGPYNMCFSVQDGREAAADAKEKGIGIEMILEGEHPGLVPPYKEAFFKDDDMVVPGIFVMSRHEKTT